MASYATVEKGTIETIVGKEFKIEGGMIATHIAGNLSYPEDAFRVIREEQKRIKPSVGSRIPTIYTLEALKSGTYEIEYQSRFTFGQNKGQVSSADLYHIVVSE
jgi:hypothetical protein